VQQAFTLVSLDGISFDTDATDAGWEDLLETLSPTQQAAFIAGPAPFTSPSYKVVGNMVYLRGVLERKVTSDDDSDVVPVLGYLPQTSRPEHNMHYPTLALDGTELHHITVSSSGQVQVQFDVSDGFVALDGIAFARWSGDFSFDDWRFGTDDGDTMQLQQKATGKGNDTHIRLASHGLRSAVIINAFSTEGVLHTTRNGAAGSEWAHKSPYNSGQYISHGDGLSFTCPWHRR